MRHRLARRLLPQLLDATLPADTEREVRGHASRCPRCHRALSELELCERLVGQLPHALAPLLDPSLEEQRLAGLASWAFLRLRRERAQRWLAAEGAAAALVAAALAGVVAFAGATAWLPSATSGTGDLVQVAYVMPGTASR